MTPAIYRITNLINSKSYVGQSNDVESRIRQHKSDLRGGYHKNKHLQSSWNKYGEENFEFEVVKECEVKYLDDLEIYYIQFFDAMNPEHGYNNESGGNKNKTFSPESRAKMSKAKKGKNHPRTKYMLWNNEKCHYQKGTIFKKNRNGLNPRRCFQTKYNSKKLPIGYNLDFISCEIIHDLISDALRDKN